MKQEREQVRGRSEDYDWTWGPTGGSAGVGGRARRSKEAKWDDER